MVVALDPDGDGQAVAHVDHPRPFARSHQYPWGLSGERPQIAAGRLVGTVLRPHDRIHGELELGRVVAEELDDGRELVVGQAQLTMKWRRVTHDDRPTSPVLSYANPGCESDTLSPAGIRWSTRTRWRFMAAIHGHDSRSIGAWQWRRQSAP